MPPKQRPKKPSKRIIVPSEYRHPEHRVLTPSAFVVLGNKLLRRLEEGKLQRQIFDQAIQDLYKLAEIEGLPKKVLNQMKAREENLHLKMQGKPEKLPPKQQAIKNAIDKTIKIVLGLAIRSYGFEKAQSVRYLIEANFKLAHGMAQRQQANNVYYHVLNAIDVKKTNVVDLIEKNEPLFLDAQNKEAHIRRSERELEEKELKLPEATIRRMYGQMPGLYSDVRNVYEKIIKNLRLQIKRINEMEKRLREDISFVPKQITKSVYTSLNELSKEETKKFMKIPGAVKALGHLIQLFAADLTLELTKRADLDTMKELRRQAKKDLELFKEKLDRTKAMEETWRKRRDEKEREIRNAIPASRKRRIERKRKKK